MLRLGQRLGGGQPSGHRASLPVAARRASRAFHRHSSSPATSRFAGSTASYWRRARSASYRAWVSASSAWAARFRACSCSRIAGPPRGAAFDAQRLVTTAIPRWPPAASTRTAAECDARTRPVIQMRIAAAVANAHALVAVVADAEPPAAMPAAQQAGQQPVPAANRARGPPRPPACCIVGDHALVPFILRPGNIALVVIHDQYIPLLTVPVQPTPDALAPVLDGDAAAPCDRRRRRRRRSDWSADLWIVLYTGSFHTTRRPSPMSSTAGSRTSSWRSHRCTCRMLCNAANLRNTSPIASCHPPVRVLGDAVVSDLHVADRDVEEQLTALRLLPQRFERALAQQRQLQLADIDPCMPSNNRSFGRRGS